MRSVVQAFVMPPAWLAMAALLDALPAEKRAAVIELATTTVLTHAQALDALERVAWDMEQAKVIALEAAYRRREWTP